MGQQTHNGQRKKGEKGAKEGDHKPMLLETLKIQGNIWQGLVLHKKKKQGEQY